MVSHIVVYMSHRQTKSAGQIFQLMSFNFLSTFGLINEKVTQLSHRHEIGVIFSHPRKCGEKFRNNCKPWRSEISNEGYI
jgi:hypothetical protein